MCVCVCVCVLVSVNVYVYEILYACKWVGGGSGGGVCGCVGKGEPGVSSLLLLLLFRSLVWGAWCVHVHVCVSARVCVGEWGCHKEHPLTHHTHFSPPSTSTNTPHDLTGTS